jgi:hypothetical protein
VLCVKGGDITPVFTYAIPSPNATSVSTSSSSESQNGEKCRLRTERFREEELENKLRASIEGLREKAEDIRTESENNLSLYKQLIFAYHGLRDLYRNSVQTYKDANRSCRPYATRPSRTS